MKTFNNPYIINNDNKDWQFALSKDLFDYVESKFCVYDDKNANMQNDIENLKKQVNLSNIIISNNTSNKDRTLNHNTLVSIASVDKMKDKSNDNVKIVDEIIEGCKRVMDDWAMEEDIRIQIQYATIITKKIDRLRKLDKIKNDVNKMKGTALIRMVIKLNMEECILSNEQLTTIENMLETICRDDENVDIVVINRKFREVGLLTVPSWE